MKKYGENVVLDENESEITMDICWNDRIKRTKDKDKYLHTVPYYTRER